MGIRKTSLSSGGTNKKPQDDDRYEDTRWDYHEPRRYVPKPKNYDMIKVTISIPYAEIGTYSMYNMPEYDYDKAQETAEDLAIIKLETYFGKSLADDFEIVVQADDTYINGFDVEVELTPITK
jgi:hypothetical protein